MKPMRHFAGLRWKLTRTYMLVTVSALLAAELIVVVFVLAVEIFLVYQAPALIARDMVPYVSTSLDPYFTVDGADLDGLHSWVEDVRRSGIEVRDEDSGFEIIAQDLGSADARLLVLDADGRLVAEVGQTAPRAAPTRLDPATVPGLDEVLPRALSGEMEPAELIARSGLRNVTIAVPVIDDGTVEGAVVLTGPFGPGFGFALPAVVALAVGALIFTVVSGAIGLLFGYITARGLTRRLGNVAAAVSEWGSGNFRARVDDRSADELGQLGRDLDRVAGEVETLVRDRQELSAIEERNRLARELHDTVKQQVFAISMNLGAAQASWERDPETAQRNITAAYDLARRSQQDLSDVIQALRPSELVDKPAHQAVGDLVERWRDDTGIAANYEADVQVPLPQKVEDALYRIVQETLSNVARHSGASTVHVTLTARRRAVLLDVADDGRGFATWRRAPGMGLRTIRERAADVGGEAKIESSQRGTIVQVRLPLGQGADGND